MKKCELCNSIATMFCESDQASLCWDCDARVHSANFLVAKHSRTLLCKSCQSVTPWTGSGPKLGPTVSVCESCVHKSSNNINDQDPDHDHGHGHVDDDDDDDDEEDEDEDDEEDEDEQDEDEDEDEDDGENQVVPLSSSSLAPPQVSSSSSSEESSGRIFNGGENNKQSRFSFSWRRTH